VNSELILVSAGYNLDQIKSHCWNKSCGQGGCGAYNMAGGAFISCGRDFTKCPLFEAEIFLHYAKDGRAIFVRKLKVK